MNHRTNFYRNSIGKKAVVAATGGVLFLFVVGHMLGNLKAFLGSSEGVPEVDLYARFLRTVGAPAIPYSGALWTVRVILLVCVCAHVVAAVRLAALNRSARPVPYVRRTYIAASHSARWMLWTGLLLIVFIVAHILHFTTGTIDITPILSGQVYSNMYHAFSVWYIVLFYVAGMIVLAWHLYHGVWSFFQTLGLDNPDRNRALRRFAAASAVLLLIGFCAVPVSFWLGWLPAPPDVAPEIQVRHAADESLPGVALPSATTKTSTTNTSTTKTSTTNTSTTNTSTTNTSTTNTSTTRKRVSHPPHTRLRVVLVNSGQKTSNSPITDVAEVAKTSESRSWKVRTLASPATGKFGSAVQVKVGAR